MDQEWSFEELDSQEVERTQQIRAPLRARHNVPASRSANLDPEYFFLYTKVARLSRVFHEKGLKRHGLFARLVGEAAAKELRPASAKRFAWQHNLRQNKRF
jgi:hypothetical protein